MRIISIQLNAVINCMKQGLRYEHVNSHWFITTYNYTLFTSMLIHICGFLIFSEIYIAHISTFHIKGGLEPYVQNLCQWRITGYLRYYSSKWRGEWEKTYKWWGETEGRRTVRAMQFTSIPLIAMHRYDELEQCCYPQRNL